MTVKNPHPGLRSERLIRQTSGGTILHLKGQRIAIPAVLLVEKVTQAVEEFPGRAKLVAGVAQQFFIGTEFGGPFDEVNIAKAAGAFFDIRFEMINRVVELVMPRD